MTDISLMTQDNIDAFLRHGIKSCLDEATFSPDEKDRIAQNVRTGIAQAQKRKIDVARLAPSRRRPRTAFRFAIAAAAVVAAMCVGTFAYASGALVTVGDAIATIFGAGPTSTEVVNKIGRPIGAAQSVNGVTVSADAIIADGQNYSIVYSIQKDDGTPFEGLVANDYGFLNLTNRDQFTDVMGTFSIAQLFDGDQNGVLGAYGSSYFYDANPDDPAIQMVEQMSMTGEHDTIIGKTAHARFGDFLAIDGDDYEDPIAIASGNWNLAFTIDCEDASVELPAGLSFQTANGEATMDALTLSPIAVSMKYRLVPNGDIQPEGHDEFADASGVGDIKMLMADGTEIAVHNPGGIGMAAQADGSIICDQNVFLPQIIDPDQVAGIAIGGTLFSAG